MSLIFLFLSFISVSVAISPSSVAVWRLGCCHRNPTWPCLLPGCTRRLKPTAQPYWRLTTCLQLFCGWQIFFSAFVLSLTYVHTHQDQHAHTLTSSVWSFAFKISFDCILENVTYFCFFANLILNKPQMGTLAPCEMHYRKGEGAYFL